ncbi:MAG: uroporphyrinogen decarboxylase family protein [Candidatus Hermodarchaeota archaeon]
MDAVERVIKTIHHEEPDRVPAWESAFTNNTIAQHYGIEEGRGDFGISLLKNVPDKMKIVNQVITSKRLMKPGFKRYFQLFHNIGLDIGTCISTNFPRLVLEDSTGFVDEYGRIMKFEYYQKDGTVIMGYHGGYLKSFEDYESWEPMDPNFKARLVGYLAGKEIQEDMNNEILAAPAIGAIMENPLEGFGLETFSRILTKNKQVKKIFDDYGNFTLELVKVLAENGAKLIILWDDYGYKNGLFMRPENYRKYVFPWLKQVCDAAHKLDSHILLHSDGDLMEIFEDIIKCGVDVLNPIEPTTANPEYDIFKLNQKYKGQITFCGNLSPQMLTTGEITEVEAYAKRLIRELAPGGGYIFSSGHSINPAVTLERFQAMQNIKKKYGNYPIKIPN